MALPRWLAASFLAALAGVACSSSNAASPAPDAGYCESNGYEPPVNGACPKGTCRASGAASACCGSLCASCEAKGLVSYTEAGACPEGLCMSTDVTASLDCCDTCQPIGGEAGVDATAEGSPGEAGVDAPADAPEDAPSDGRARDGSKD